ncbi:HD domain-containing protein [Apilactobacillus xinyiensis]|uniref:HD domain-containing protein n=1 Tax=Apilactobacillus xinyiensis TaxID=2841032 RepID=A0ABT0I087_9LACO|nr:HD domain-containing protein [Apilactobacillus xinyiensis]MCK8624208.1 HD domain-containing protein [Apilactobacillus xinyiensis]MCL0318426.1 HD domain-containing protein [Apilactobacillus xinyiensis]MCL0329486.1 HD domain-containing protein [Apilactobacillus xinyiensis]
MKKENWQLDTKYLALVDDILSNEQFKKLDNYIQHHNSTRMMHCISVSYASYQIAEKLHLDVKSIARAGLLHDLFYYDWRETKFNLGSHAFMHPRIAVRNAEKITSLNEKEKDIILKHMWGFTLARPKYAESYIVSFVDDYEAVSEYCKSLMKKPLVKKILRR